MLNNSSEFFLFSFLACDHHVTWVTEDVSALDMQTRSKQSEWKPSLSSCCRIKQKELLTFCRLWESISASVQSNWSFQAENNEWMWDAAWLSPSLGGGSLSPPWKTPWTGASIKSHQLFTVSTWSQRWRSQAEGLPSPPPEPTHHETKTETAKKQPAFFPLLQPLDLVTPLHIEIAWEANLKKRGKKAISCMNHSTTNSQCVCLKRIQFCLRCPWWCSLSVAPPRISLCVHVCLITISFLPSRTHIYFFTSWISLLCFVLFCFFLPQYFSHLHSQTGVDTRSAVGLHAGSPLPCQVERTHTCLQMRAKSRRGSGTEGESSTAVDYRYGSGQGIYWTALPVDVRLHLHMVQRPSGAEPPSGTRFDVMFFSIRCIFKIHHSNSPH